MPDKVALVLLSYNGLSVTKKFFEHLGTNTDPDLFRLFWIDNGSTDGTVQFLDELKTDGVREYDLDVEFQDKNLGVIGGRNVGFKAFLEDTRLSDCSHLMFLDNDQFVKKGWLEHHLAVLNRGYDLIGVEAWQMNKKFLPILKNERLSDWFCYVGCGGMLIRREAVEKLGGFDERFNPSYYEDPDYCFRAADAKLKVGWNYRAKILHMPHQTLGVASDRMKRFKNSLKKFQDKWANREVPKFLQQMLPEFEKC